MTYNASQNSSKLANCAFKKVACTLGMKEHNEGVELV
jgi:hypothetical protein